MKTRSGPAGPATTLSCRIATVSAPCSAGPAYTTFPATMARIAAVRERIAASGREILIAVDGGVTMRNVGQLAGSGVDLVVTGSAVFSGDLASNVRAMTEALRVRT